MGLHLLPVYSKGEVEICAKTRGTAMNEVHHIFSEVFLNLGA